MQEYILQMQNITKKFPGVKALNNVNFSVKKGEIHALVGENGAGKSTLIKILCGVYPYGTYEGQIIFNGEEKRFATIKCVENAGIACIHQELHLAPDLSISENIFLNNKPNRFGIVNFDEMYRKTMELLGKIGLDIKSKNGVTPNDKIRNLGIGQRQLVEIAKALSVEAKLLILDEPTAALSEAETGILLNILDGLREKGVTCIYISHKLDEVMQIADTITILRDGETIETREKKNMSKETMIRLMVGRELKNMYPRVPHRRGALSFELKNYSVAHPDIMGKMLINNVNIKAYKGEILGIIGLVGSGRTELFTSVFGAFSEPARGEVFIEGEKVDIKSPMDALHNGFLLLSEDRKKFGLNLIMSIKENIILAALRKVAHWGVINSDKAVCETNRYINDLKIKTPSCEVLANTLSGGNQQKVVFAKCLMTVPKIIVLDEPTRGIDVGAKYEIYKIMNELVDQGVTIIMISSEMEEILGMSDRIITMSNGIITGEFEITEATQEKLMHASARREN
ncbi:abc transporter [Lucifera butyrica]|uniref:Abc transporter n=1 Tax=Lucifera butyrica TaxID=1351585 RepID=A0A498RGG8_9FIRM|nr:ATP-binding cassette domain-containing protein [Lucifera butyrica]VBB08208.1 abc transporter [Lucifera butyrica]